MPHLTRRRLVKARARLPRCVLCLRPLQVTRNGYPWCPSDKTYAQERKHNGNQLLSNPR